MVAQPKQKAKQDLCKFKATLVYIMEYSQPGLYSKTPFQKNKTKQHSPQ